MLVKCEACGTEFEKTRRLDGRHYCSVRCGNIGRAKRGQKQRNCVVCNTDFVTNVGNQKCCSEKCVVKWGVIKTKRDYDAQKLANRASATCVVCKREFEYHFRPDRGARQFCGRSCASKHYILIDVYASWQTNGKRSKFELEIEEHLKEMFSGVKNTVKVNGWYIDLYVEEIDTYVQADGVFWHGLDRSLDEIRKLKYEVDHDILKNYARDREADKWFSENGRKLVRVTDIEWKQEVNKRALLLRKLGRETDEPEKENPSLERSPSIN